MVSWMRARRYGACDDGGAAMVNGRRRDGTSFVSFTYARVGSFSFPVRLLWKYGK